MHGGSGAVTYAGSDSEKVQTSFCFLSFKPSRARMAHNWMFTVQNNRLYKNNCETSTPTQQN
jgi:hypothetical protein